MLNANENQGIPRILICEDNLSILGLLSNTLREKGYLVYEVNNGLAAMKLLKDNKFDAIITDIMLPKASGIEVLTVSREHNKGAAVFVITAIDSAFLDAMAKDFFNVKAVFKKPFNINVVIEDITNEVQRMESERSDALVLATRLCLSRN